MNWFPEQSVWVLLVDLEELEGPGPPVGHRAQTRGDQRVEHAHVHVTHVLGLLEPDPGGGGGGVARMHDGELGEDLLPRVW